VPALRGEASPGKVGRNGCGADAVKPSTVTVIRAKYAPAGTVTASSEDEAELTAALTPPKNTTFSAGSGLKFSPEMVICEETLATPGWTVVTLGTAPRAQSGPAKSKASTEKTKAKDEMQAPKFSVFDLIGPPARQKPK
jgi:hypothetical protein